MPRERVILIETFDERDVPVREPAAELEFTGTGPARGEYEDGRWDGVEYIPPLEHTWRP